MGSRNFLPKLVKGSILYLYLMDGWGGGVPDGKGIDGLIRNYQKLG